MAGYFRLEDGRIVWASVAPANAERLSYGPTLRPAPEKPGEAYAAYLAESPLRCFQ